MVSDTLEAFRKCVAPKLSIMQSGILHGDAHDGNIILECDMNGCHHVAGIIDFSDCHMSCYVFELAVALAHNMQRMADPVLQACPFISGFLQAFPLSDDELGCLFPSVLARLCVVAVVVEDTCTADHSQDQAHLRGASMPFWNLLDKLLTHGREKVNGVWMKARGRSRDHYGTSAV